MANQPSSGSLLSEQAARVGATNMFGCKVSPCPYRSPVVSCTTLRAYPSTSMKHRIQDRLRLDGGREVVVASIQVVADNNLQILELRLRDA